MFSMFPVHSECPVDECCLGVVGRERDGSAYDDKSVYVQAHQNGCENQPSRGYFLSDPGRWYPGLLATEEASKALRLFVRLDFRVDTAFFRL